MAIARAVLEASGGPGDTAVTLPRAGRWHELLSGRDIDSDGTVRVSDLPLPWAVLVIEGRAG